METQVVLGHPLGPEAGRSRAPARVPVEFVHPVQIAGELLLRVGQEAGHSVPCQLGRVGEVDTMHAVAGRFGHAGPADDPDAVDDATVALLRFSRGAVATVSATCLADRKHRAGIELVAGGLALALTEDGLVAGDREWRPTIDVRVAVDRAFLDALHADDPTLVGADYADALRTHRLACAVATSAHTGEPVHLGNAPVDRAPVDPAPVDPAPASPAP